MAFTGSDIAFGDFALPRGSAAGGTSGGTAGANKLWLPLWSGEVIHAYDQFNMFESLVTTKTLTGGMSWDFPVTGTVALNPSWNAGVELGAGTVSPSTTFKVTLDKRPMASHFECDNIDLLITQWDYRGELARQAGLTLSNNRDRQLAVALVAAGAVPQISSDPHVNAAGFQDPGTISNTVLASACTEIEALRVLQEIENYFVACQENDVTTGNVYCAVTPKVFQVIRALGIPRSTIAGAMVAVNALNYQAPVFGGNSDYNMGSPLSNGMNSMMDSLDYMGCKIVKTNHIPKTGLDTVANNIGSSKYNLACGTLAYQAAANTTATTLSVGSLFSIYGIIFQTEAVAGLSLQGLKVDSIADVRRNTQFTVASMMKGTGIIKPELVKVLVSGAITATRANLALHINGTSVSGAATHGNYASGFATDYAVTSAYA